MGDGSKIEWTDATWNPTRGCRPVSPECDNCYAERVAARFSGPGMPYEGLAKMHARVVDKATGEMKYEPRWTGVGRLVPEHLADPLRWKRPRRIFVDSMSDLFFEKFTNEEIAAVFGVMAASPQHTFQVLTKRPERMRDWFEWRGPRPTASVGYARVTMCCRAAEDRGVKIPVTETVRQMIIEDRWPLPNVWLGISAGTQGTLDASAPALFDSPAAVYFLSAEPLLDSMDIRPYLPDPGLRSRTGPDWKRRSALDWVIVGGESGPGARPMHTEWARSLRDQCVEADVAFHFKQHGEHRDLVRLGKKAAGRELDGRTWDEFPEAR